MSVSLSSSVTNSFLIPASPFLIEIIDQLLLDRLVNERTISGCINGEVDVGFVLKEGIIPATIGARLVWRVKTERERLTYLLIIKAVVTIFSPSTVPASMALFC
jgi:hypothetical protein